MQNHHAAQPSASLPPIVLLVEDDLDTSEMYQAAFELGGLWVAHARDVDDALDYALDLRPDVVVMDVGLPSPDDGISLARELRDDPRVGDTPIVAVTGFDAKRLGGGVQLFSEVFTKPVALDVLVPRLKRLASRSAGLRERSDRARERVPALLDRSAELIRRGQEIGDNVAAKTPGVRRCPKCRHTLRFSERRELEGVLFDYYLPCRRGCGLFYYDHSRRKLIALIE